MRKVLFTRHAERQIEKLVKRSPEVAREVASQVESLGLSPKPPGSRKLLGYPYHRLRVGNYRVIYEFDEDRLQVLLVERRDKVYRSLGKRLA